MTSVISVTNEVLHGWPLPEPEADGDKDSRGSVVVVGGSVCMPGCISLTAEACLRSGAGKVQIFTDEASTVIARHLPEAWVGVLAAECAEHKMARRCHALAIGPGLASAADAERVVTWFAAHIARVPTVLDAYGLAAVHLVKDHAAGLVLTPNAVEMAMLCGWSKREVQERPLEAARSLAADCAAVVMLKGPTTWIVAPNGDAWSSATGSIGLGTAGSGDVLAGICAGLLAQGAPPVQAAVWAAHVHGLCGDHLARTIGPVGFLARELLPLIPRIRVQLAQGTCFEP